MNVRPATADDVVELVGLLADAGVVSWLAGGWGCDALLGYQSRTRVDVDLIVSHDAGAAARETLERAGFYLEQSIEGGCWMPLQLEMKDLRRSVGLHPVDFSVWHAPRGRGSLAEMAQMIGVHHIGEVFVTGRVGGHVVPCLSATAQLVLHCGYELRDRDRRDVEALCRHFDLPLPLPYASSQGTSDAVLPKAT